MAYIDVDLDDFDLDDILDYISNEYNRGRYTITLEQWSKSVFGLEEPNLSVNDKLKMDCIKENFDKLTIENLNTIL